MKKPPELYFSDDVYLGKLRTDLEREEVKLEDISKDLQNAVIATEDEYFNEHNGVVPKAIMRAVTAGIHQFIHPIGWKHTHSTADQKPDPHQ